MGKLHGIPMGCDACYTNHADADQNDLENLEVLLATAGCNFFMGLPMGDDVMLNYQSTSFHDGATLRQLFGFRPAPEFEAWLEEMGIMRDGKLTPRAGDPSVVRSMKPTAHRRSRPHRGDGARGAHRATRARRGGRGARGGVTAGALLLTPDRGVNIGEPYDPPVMARVLASTPARVARRAASGPRYHTNTMLRFRADHAAAKDAVLSEVDPELLARLGMFEVASRAPDKAIFLQRPDLGRALSDEGRAELGQADRPRADAGRRSTATGCRPPRSTSTWPSSTARWSARSPRAASATRRRSSCATRASRSWTRSPAWSARRRRCSCAASARASGSPTRCRPTTSINRPPARPTPTAR